MNPRLLNLAVALLPTGMARAVLARYEGAQYSTSRSTIQQAITAARFEASEGVREQLLKKSRYFQNNNAILNKCADLFESYTVGSGLQVQPASSDRDWNKKAKQWFTNESPSFDLTSRQGLETMEGLAARAEFIDGEAFVLRQRGAGGRPRYQLIEGTCVRTPTELRDDPTIVEGIRLDGNGCPTSYYIGTEEKSGKYVFKNQPTDAAAVFHLFEPSRPGQLRGLPFCYPVINDLHDLDDLQMLEMKAAKDASDISNVIKTTTGELPSVAALRRSRVSQGTEMSGGTTQTEDRAAFVRDAIGGRTVALRIGEDLAQHRSDRPSVAVAAYWKYLTDKICAGIGIPSVLVFPESMQGTVYRGALDCAATFFRARFLPLAEMVRWIYRGAVGWAKATELPGAPPDWDRVTILPPRAVNVDVGRNSAALLAEIAAGANDYELHYSALGLDWRERFDRLAEQRAYAAEKGLILTIGNAPVAAEPEPDEPPLPEKGPDASPMLS